MKSCYVSFSFLFLTSALAALTTTAAKSHQICHLADRGVTPFPNAVCEPFTTSNNAAVAVFRQDPVSFNKSHYMTIKMVTCHSKAEGTIWNRNRAGEYEDDFCDSIRGTHSNSSSPRMPLVAECVAVKEWAAANAGHWVVSNNDLNEHNRVVLLAVGSCAFIVDATEEKRTNTGVIISSKDVTKAMQDVIKKPHIRGRVEVAGRFSCITGDGRDKVAANWYIAHTEIIDWDE